MNLKIGKRPAIAVPSLASASAIYTSLRDASGLGASEFPAGAITDGRTRLRVSYNGRVWNGDQLVYDPSATADATA